VVGGREGGRAAIAAVPLQIASTRGSQWRRHLDLVDGGDQL
jgi:hypothetical protein